MTQKLNALVLGYASGIVFALVMLLIGILGNLGLYMDGFEAMQQWHIFFDLTILGIILGMIEAAVISFIIAYVLALIYNKFA